MTNERYLALVEVTKVTGLSRSTIWRGQRRGTFPPSERLTNGRVGIAESHVDRWLAGERSGWPKGVGGVWRGPAGAHGRKKT